MAAERRRVRVRRVSLENAVWEVICDDDGIMLNHAPGGAELAHVDVIVNCGFWDHYRITRTRRVELDPAKITWTYLLERAHTLDT